VDGGGHAHGEDPGRWMLWVETSPGSLADPRLWARVPGALSHYYSPSGSHIFSEWTDGFLLRDFLQPILTETWEEGEQTEKFTCCPMWSVR
jgi:hypothetical protein